MVSYVAIGIFKTYLQIRKVLVVVVYGKTLGVEVGLRWVGDRVVLGEDGGQGCFVTILALGLRVHD